MAVLIIAAMLMTTPPAAFRAASVFDSGQLYLRTMRMEPEGDFRRDRATGIPEYSEGCEGSRALDRELELWNSAMLRLWDRVNTAETYFTIRSGDEYLMYETYFLFYISSSERVQIEVFPEELWAILSMLDRPGTALTSQTSMDGWYPGLCEPAQVFIGTGDPAFDTVQLLLERGREAL